MTIEPTAHNAARSRHARQRRQTIRHEAQCPTAGYRQRMLLGIALACWLAGCTSHGETPATLETAHEAARAPNAIVGASPVALSPSAPPTSSASAAPNVVTTPTPAVFRGGPVTATTTTTSIAGTLTPSTDPAPVAPPGLPIPSPEWHDVPSPDGTWQVRSYSGPEVAVTDTDGATSEWYYVAQHVVAADGSVVHRLADEWRPFGLGAPSPGVLGWSPDGGSVFVMESGFSGDCDIFGWGSNLRQLDVASGIETPLERFLYGPRLLGDMRRVVFSERDRIIVRDLVDGQIVTVPLADVADPDAGDSVRIGGWVESPSGQRVAFWFAPRPCVLEGIGVLDLDAATATLLVPAARGSHLVARWDDEDAVIVRSEPEAYVEQRGSPQPPIERRVDVPR